MPHMMQGSVGDPTIHRGRETSIWVGGSVCRGSAGHQLRLQHGCLAGLSRDFDSLARHSRIASHHQFRQDYRGVTLPQAATSAWTVTLGRSGRVVGHRVPTQTRTPPVESPFAALSTRDSSWECVLTGYVQVGRTSEAPTNHGWRSGGRRGKGLGRLASRGSSAPLLPATTSVSALLSADTWLP